MMDGTRGKDAVSEFLGSARKKGSILPVNLKVGIVERDQPIGGRPSVACRGPFQHINRIPVSDQHAFTSEVRFYLHQFIHLQQLKERSI